MSFRFRDHVHVLFRDIIEMWRPSFKIVLGNLDLN